MRVVLRWARTHFLLTVFSFAALSGGPAALAAEPESAAATLGKKYTATACLLVERHEPHILPRAAERDEPAEFESYRATQMQLIKSRYVLIAALRDPTVQSQPSIKREEGRHHAVVWLGKEIRVKCPDKRTGILTVSLTSSDPVEAAVLVNAVVEAYMREAVNVERQMRRDRLADLQQIAAEKENEVRTKKEQLKRELENIGAGDDETMKARGALAVQMYAEFQRQFQTMKTEQRALRGQLQAAKTALLELRDAEIPEIQVVAILNSDPVYHDLQSRLALLESNMPNTGARAAGTEQPRIVADFERTMKQVQKLEADTRQQIRDARRIELEKEVRRLEIQEKILTDQMPGFEKEVERKGNEADSVRRSSVAAQMARGDVDEVQRIYRAVAAERETQRIELRAAPRVRVLGDKDSPAAVPECPD